MDHISSSGPLPRLPESALVGAFRSIRSEEAFGNPDDVARINRRIFADRTGLAAARNQKPFLLQTYRRDMGGGAFLVMQDLSAPIRLKGRHWGGFRFGLNV